jgi:hypothetical protein
VAPTSQKGDWMSHSEESATTNNQGEEEHPETDKHIATENDDDVGTNVDNRVLQSARLGGQHAGRRIAHHIRKRAPRLIKYIINAIIAGLIFEAIRFVIGHL